MGKQLKKINDTRVYDDVYHYLMCCDLDFQIDLILIKWPVLERHADRNCDLKFALTKKEIDPHPTLIKNNVFV